MLDYRVKIGLVAMRRNTTDRPRGTFLTWYSAEQREKKNIDYTVESGNSAPGSRNWVVRKTGLCSKLSDGKTIRFYPSGKQ